MNESPSPLFPSEYDPTYFGPETWARRVEHWLHANRDSGFAGGNVDVVRRVLSDPETGLRMVVNITADALRGFLREGVYRNLYETPVIGGKPKTPSQERLDVDSRLGIGPNTYFGAVALGGSGIRFYGEYCMVLERERIEPETPLFDRDSYDILSAPLRELERNDAQLACLRGTWAQDAVSMALRRVLPEIGHDERLVTSGTISELVLRDQEYIEVHLDGTFNISHIEEVRYSPDDAATEASIAERERQGLHTTLVERLWHQRRSDVARDLAAAGIRQRVVTLHGRGYQWK